MNMPQPSGQLDGRAAVAALHEIVDDVARLLPEQAPLHAFVHHNTLHLFEDLSFDKAVLAGSLAFGAEPYQSEAAFAEHVASGRVSAGDLDAVVAAACDPASASLCFPGALALDRFRRLRLDHLFALPQGPQVAWLVHETDLLRRPLPELGRERREAIEGMGMAASGGARRRGESPVAALLDSVWHALIDAAATIPVAKPAVSVRRRDLLLNATGIDMDETVHPLLIRVSAAFLDQGIAYWSMPRRAHGFLAAFRHIYGQPFAVSERRLRGLAQTLAEHEREQFTAEATVVWALGQLGHASEDWSEVIRESLLSLRGWAGMMHHLEHRPDRAPTRNPNASLMDYLAVQLALEAIVARNVLRECGDGALFRGRELAAPLPRETALVIDPTVYEAFVLAQRMPVSLGELVHSDHARRWLYCVREFDHLERRRLLHLAYERRHRHQVLDGLAARRREGAVIVPRPSLQAVFCIDEREESLRRHLEETFPASETFGYAGFFGVAMDYKGFDDVRPRPLCPVVLRPAHFVLERPKSRPTNRGIALDGACRPYSHTGFPSAR